MTPIVLHGSSVTLRPLDDGDIDALYEYMSLPEVVHPPVCRCSVRKGRRRITSESG